MTGPQLVQEIHPSYPDLRVLYMSGDPNGDPLLRRHMAEWDCGFLAKPFPATTFVRAVQKLLTTPQGAQAVLRARDARRSLR